MNNEMKINTELMEAEIAKLEDVTREMQELFSKIRNETESLKDCWQTRTSDGVYTDFNMFYKILDEVKAVNEQDISFLKNVVNASYTKYEDKTNNLIDNNIAI